MQDMQVMSEVYVGPASVRGLKDGKVLLAMPDGSGEAELALAYPYSPCRGDVVLVCGTTDLYVIGVLRAQGVTRIDIPGDVVIGAGGKLRLQAGQAVEIESPRVGLRADRFEILAHSLFERVTDAYRWARGVVQTTAGRIRSVVSGTASLQAERIVEIASKDVHIDGERINLG